MSFYDFSATPASNTTVGGIGSQGSSSANLIDDLVRELAASGRQFANDIGGSNTVGGTADAITVTPSSGAVTAAFDGLVIGFIAGADNATATPTANVGGLGAEPIKKAVLGAETAVVAGDIKSGGFYLLRWRSAWDSSGGAWELVNPETLSAITIKGEGTATTNLPQGLAKAWCSTNMATASVKDSFNVTSITDNGTGDFTVTLTNAMANANCSLTASAFDRINQSIVTSASAHRQIAENSSFARVDTTGFSTTVHGDLA